MEVSGLNRAQRRAAEHPKGPGRPGRPKGSRNKPKEPTFLAARKSLKASIGISENSPGSGANAGEDIPQELPPLEPEDRPEDKPPAERRAAGVSKRSAKVVDGLAKNFGMLGMIVYAANRYDGEILLNSALPMAEALEEVGKKNRNVYRVLILLSSGSEWTTLFAVFGGVTVAIGANHGLVPTGWTRVFNMPAPPTKQTSEGTLNTGNSTVSMGPSDGAEPAQNGAVNGSTEAPGVPGLHIDADQFNLIREQAAKEALRQYQLAQQQGIVP